MSTLVLMLALLGLSGTAPFPAALTEAAPACPEAAERCFGVRLFVTTAEDGVTPSQPVPWVLTQLAQANEHFAALSVGFELDVVTLIGDGDAHVASRGQRDLLGRDRFRRGVIDVYLVTQLDDVDIAGAVIRGVHWRDRKDRKRRWIIMSAIAPPHVLAHELGHYFGLPHSTYAGSLMNKSRKDPTPWSERTFVQKERRRALGWARRYVREGTLKNRR